MTLQLDRPLVVFDLETTGVDVANDRIVELAAAILLPGGGRETKTWLINPERLIPPGATKVHGISDADVADAPTFADLGGELAAIFDGADLSGFNAERFDVPLLRAEFARIGRTFPTPGTHILDSHTIFVKREPRNLAAAVTFYCGRSLDGAHRAEADAVAAADVLLGQLERYPDLPREVGALYEALHPTDPNSVDASGKLAWHDGQAVLTFGKHRDRSLQELVKSEPDYLRWVLGKDFPDDTRHIISEALEGRYPSRG